MYEYQSILDLYINEIKNNIIIILNFSKINLEYLVIIIL